jgi:uridine kinase
MNIQEFLHKFDNVKKGIIAIDGPSASGKSTLAKLLQRRWNATVIHTDNYFLPEHLKTKEKLRKPGENLDHERLQIEVFSRLESPTIQINHFDCKKQKLITKGFVPTKGIIIVEGVYSLHPNYQKYYDAKIFLNVDKSTQKERILQRNGKQILQKFVTQWIPLENQYFDAFNISQCADVAFQLEDFTDFLGD